MKDIKKLKVVVASSSDVMPERDLVEEVAKEINGGVAADRDLWLEVARWETDAYPGFHAKGPQGLIDPILNIKDCDILIGIFWKRFGTPTTEAKSGTEHEIRTAYEAWKEKGRPHIMVYFNQKSYTPRSKAETDQWGLVLQFQANFPKEGLWRPYKGESDFEKQVRRHLQNYIRQHYKLSGQASRRVSRREIPDQAEAQEHPRGGDDEAQAPSEEGNLDEALEQAPSPTYKNDIGMEFVLIEAGSFEMGSTKGEEDECPVRRVTVSQPFYLGKYEVTQAQWKAVMGENPSAFQGKKRPVESVSWEDVQNFIGRLNEQENGSASYRLPTEAEWEYAARAGTTEGDTDPLDAQGWYDENAGEQTHPVGRKKPNAWELYDMYGNVWEWVEDRYGAYLPSSVADPAGPSSGSDRVVRGGSWYNIAWFARSAFRNHFASDYRFYYLGFRLVREVEQHATTESL